MFGVGVFPRLARVLESSGTVLYSTAPMFAGRGQGGTSTWGTYLGIGGGDWDFVQATGGRPWAMGKGGRAVGGVLCLGGVLGLGGQARYEKVQGNGVVLTGGR